MRPSSITIEILQNNNVYNTITLTEANNWEMNDVVVPRFDENGNEYVYTVREATLTGYTPSYAYQESYSGPVKLKFSHFDLFDEGIHTFTIIYELDGEYYSFEIDDGDGSSLPSYGKEFINLDENNCIEIPSSNFYIDYSWGYVSGNCDGFAIESIEPIESVETWYGTKIDNINSIDPDNTMIIKDITDLKLDMDNLPDHIDVEFGEAIWKYIGMEDTAYTITNTSDPEIPLTITKIWKDDNNMNNTRPDSLDITVYQNGQVYQVLTFTSANASASNTNVWATTINVPEYDAQGNKYIYTISEDESNLFLDYYYYEPYINQNTLTATNVGIWLPPLELILLLLIP